MAEYKQADLQIGTESQFESKKETLPVGTICGLTDPIHQSELDSDLQTSIDSIANKLDKPSGNPTEDSLVKVSSTGSVSYQPLATLANGIYLHTLIIVTTSSDTLNNISFIDGYAGEYTLSTWKSHYKDEDSGGSYPCYCNYWKSTTLSEGFASGLLRIMAGDVVLTKSDGLTHITINDITKDKVFKI